MWLGVTGRYRANQPRLKVLQQQAQGNCQRLMAAGVELDFYFIPREYNLLADALAADALLLTPEKQSFGLMARRETNNSTDKNRSKK